MHISVQIVYSDKNEKRENLVSGQHRNTVTLSTACLVGIALFKDSYELYAVWQFILMVWWFSALAAH